MSHLQLRGSKAMERPRDGKNRLEFGHGKAMLAGRPAPEVIMAPGTNAGHLPSQSTADPL
jgi:hypothetical protein